MKSADDHLKIIKSRGGECVWNEFRIHQFNACGSVAFLACATFIAILMSLTAAECRGDLVKMTNGGEVRGRLISAGSTTGRQSQQGDSLEQVEIETLSGATIVLARSDTLFVTMRSASLEEYETRARRTPDTLEAHWELSEWCRSKGMSKQRETHLLKVVEHNPDHQQAQTALGRVWEDGAWVNRDELMASKGYVRHKGQYITLQEFELLQKTADELELERKWFQDVKKWENWLGGRHEERRQQAIAAFAQIEDVHAAPAVIKSLCEDQKRDYRMLGVTILSRLAGTKAATGLVKQVLYDNDSEIRHAALMGIRPESFEVAQVSFVKQLRNEANAVVGRAAFGLSRVGDERAVAPLIDALVTSHKYHVPSTVPSGQTYRFGTDGSFGSSATLPPEVEASIRAGQLPQGAIILPPAGMPETPKKLVLVQVEHANPDVLTALQKITGQDFRFDERTWHLWWSAEKSTGAAGKAAKKK